MVQKMAKAKKNTAVTAFSGSGKSCAISVSLYNMPPSGGSRFIGIIFNILHLNIEKILAGNTRMYLIIFYKIVNSTFYTHKPDWL